MKIALGHFSLDKRFRLEILKILSGGGTVFSGCYDFRNVRTTLQGIPKVSKLSSRKIPFHSIFLPEFPEFSAEWFTFRKFNSFRIQFRELSKEIFVPFAAVLEFKWKAPKFFHVPLSRKKRQLDSSVRMENLPTVKPLLSGSPIKRTLSLVPK